MPDPIETAISSDDLPSTDPLPQSTASVPASLRAAAMAHQACPRLHDKIALKTSLELEVYGARPLQQDNPSMVNRRRLSLLQEAGLESDPPAIIFERVVVVVCMEAHLLLAM